jgi:HAD superfamily hydrolase (TIGR01509 family)
MMARRKKMTNKSNDWAVLFDLDETLVGTSALEPLRKKRVWPDVYKAFDKTKLPNGTLEFLKKVGKIARIGVVTKAPRSYAEKLLAHYGMEIPVLAAYHDVKKIKPDPEALLLASQKLGIPPERCIYIGDDANDVRAAQAAGMIPFGICWGKPLDIGLKSVCKNWDEIYEEVSRLIKG